MLHHTHQKALESGPKCASIVFLTSLSAIDLYKTNSSAMELIFFEVVCVDRLFVESVVDVESRNAVKADFLIDCLISPDFVLDEDD